MMGWLELIGTLFGPIYFAFMGTPFLAVPAWATACAAVWMWRSRKSRAAAAEVGFDPHVPRWYRAASNLAIFLLVGTCFFAAHTTAFFLVRLAS